MMESCPRCGGEEEKLLGVIGEPRFQCVGCRADVYADGTWAPWPKRERSPYPPFDSLFDNSETCFKYVPETVFRSEPERAETDEDAADVPAVSQDSAEVPGESPHP